MTKASGDRPPPTPSEIGKRVQTFRLRRGLSLDTAAGLAGISKSYLSMLENGHRRFRERGLLEDLATALGCSVIDLTGQPYAPGDRASADALATLPPISVALFDATLDDVPDLPARPVAGLSRLASVANMHSANARYSLAGRDLGSVLTELHIHAVTGDTDTRRAALAALVEACFVAAGNARSLGNPDLAVIASRRAQDAARRLEGDDPEIGTALSGFAAMTAAGNLSRLGARRSAQRLASDALLIVQHADPDADDTATAEAAGMLHLTQAQMAAKNHDRDLVATHLQAATELADRTGERNALQFTFGPANVRAWSLSIAVELGDGPTRAETITAMPGYDVDLTTADRKAALHFDLARAYAQGEGARDDDALRHIDLADRIAPQRLRHDPIARELVDEVTMRTTRPGWLATSLRRRFGLDGGANGTH